MKDQKQIDETEQENTEEENRRKLVELLDNLEPWEKKDGKKSVVEVVRDLRRGIFE